MSNHFRYLLSTPPTMGTYCEICGQKVIGGNIPDCCKNKIDCICDSCWDDLYDNRFDSALCIQITNDVVNSGGLSKDTMKQIHANHLNPSLCPECKKPIDFNAATSY